MKENLLGLTKKRLLCILLTVLIVTFTSSALIAYASTVNITLDGVVGGWAGKNGVTITAVSGLTNQELSYKVNTSSTDTYDDLPNVIAVAKDTVIPLTEGKNQYIHAKSGETTKTFGPINVDITDPVIELAADGINFNYRIIEENLDTNNSGYVFSNNATPPTIYTTRFTAIQGSLANSTGMKYLHIKLADQAGNSVTETSIVNTDSVVEFWSDDSVFYALINLGANVNIARTNYVLRNETVAFPVQTLKDRETKVWFTTTGTYTITVNAILNDGRSMTITSDPIIVTKVDNSGPVVFIEPYRRGSSITLLDEDSGVDLERSYVITLGDTVYFKNSAQLDIDYNTPTVELVKVVAYDKAGNITTVVFLNKFLEETISVDISYESRTYYLLADGYKPSTTLALDTDKLYYVYTGTRPILFQKEGFRDIRFYIDTNITPEELISFDVMDSKEVSWTVRNSQLYNLEESYYQRNGRGARRVIKRNQSIDREDFDYDLNFVRIYLVDWNGVEYVIDSRYFPTVYQQVIGSAEVSNDNTPSGGTSGTPSTSGTGNTPSNNNNAGGGVRADGLKYKSGYNQYINGYTDGTFRPANPITRAEFVKILSEITDGGTPKSVTFTDVSSSHWAYSFITRMAGLDVAFGQDGKFRPDEDITRAEAAAMLSRLSLNPQVQQPLVFTDVNNHPLYNDIVAASQKGLIYGYQDGSFKPDYRISRVEAVAIVNRALGRASDHTSILPAAKVPPDMKSTDWGYFDVIDAMNTHTLTTNKSSTGFFIWGSVEP